MQGPIWPNQVQKWPKPQHFIAFFHWNGKVGHCDSLIKWISACAPCTSTAASVETSLGMIISHAWMHTRSHGSSTLVENEGRPQLKTHNFLDDLLLFTIKSKQPIPVKFCLENYYADYVSGLVQDCRNSIAKALELLQSCTNHQHVLCKSSYWFRWRY